MNPSDNEIWFDENIAPKLLELCKQCNERNMSFVTVVEYDEGCRSRTIQLTKDAGLAMKMFTLSITSGENIDGYIFSLLKYCRENNVDINNSIFLTKFKGKLNVNN